MFHQNWFLDAYQKGIFPWYGEMDPVLWWSPSPRCVLYPEKVALSKSMRSILRKRQFTFYINRDFERVIQACSEPRKDEMGTWLLPEMIETYIELHQQGYAHSVEVYEKNVLVGGFYGLSMGTYLAGESMFSKVSNASKAGLLVFCQYAQAIELPLIDCQIPNPHLMRMGAEEMDRDVFIEKLESYMTKSLPNDCWSQQELFYKDY